MKKQEPTRFQRRMAALSVVVWVGVLEVLIALAFELNPSRSAMGLMALAAVACGVAGYVYVRTRGAD